MRTAKFLLSVVACAVCISSAVAFADQMNDGDEDFKPTTRQDDDRLPAVLPGEEVVTQTGQRMKVWSSAGPVPVNPMPTPQNIFGDGDGAGLGIFLDGREGGGRPGPLGGERP
jgi:hypothetical protein